MKINGIDAIYYSAKDLDRAKAFYTAIIGAPPTVDIAGSHCEWTLPHGESFGVVKGETFRPASGILFNVDDIQASVNEMRSYGVTFEDDAQIEETPVCFMAFARDTEGNAFILHQRKSH